MFNNHRRNRVFLTLIVMASTSLLFQNCSGKLNSQSFIEGSSLTGSLNFSGLNDIILLTERPKLISNKINDSIHYEISPSKIDSVDYVEFKLNSDPWKSVYDNEVLLTDLVYGEQTIFFRAYSKSGSESDILEYNWYIDNIAPTITMIAQPTAVININSAQIEFSVQETNLLTLTCTLNQQVIPGCPSPIVLYDLINLTNYEVKIKATDSAGNSTEISVPFTVAFLQPTYQALKINVFNRRCTGCHNAAQMTAGLNLSTYAGVLSAVTPGNAATSKIHIRITSTNPAIPRMPLNGTPLSVVEINTIADWINAGALNN